MENKIRFGKFGWWILAALVSLILWIILVVGITKVFAEYDAPVGRVSDFAHILSDSTVQSLETKLKAFDEKTTNEVVVVTIPTLNGDDIANYTVLLAKKWKIGKKDKNNGVVFLIAPKERKVRIEVGYGLEPVLTDAFSKRIISDTIIPHFKHRDLEGGIIAGVDSIIESLSKDTASTIIPKEDKWTAGQVLLFIVILVIVGFIVLAILVVIIDSGVGSSSGGSGGWGSGSGGGFGGSGGAFGGGGAGGGW